MPDTDYDYEHERPPEGGTTSEIALEDTRAPKNFIPHSAFRIPQSLLRSLFWLAPCLLYLYAISLAPRSAGKDLLPCPDAEEYAMLAIRLARFQPPLIGVGLYDYPSRYSLAFPVMLAPAAAILKYDATRFHFAAAFFGLLAVALMARTGGWMLGSRWAGGLAAAFFALHPQTVRAASFTMSESGMLLMFFVMLELARPWLDCGRAGGGPARAALLGLVLAWLTLAKAPYAYWALALTALAAARAVDRRQFAPLAAFAGAGGLVALADLLYRHWAFGAWGANGYAYWAPGIYTEFLKTFNPAYLHDPFTIAYEKGNLEYYGRMAMGLSNDFYGRGLALAAGCAALGLIWPGRRGKPMGIILALMAGWSAVGALFCGLYFFQEPRFFHLWVSLIDLAAAWGLVRVAMWRPRRRSGFFCLNSHLAAQAAALIFAVLILRGEYRRVLAVVQQAPEFQRPCYTGMIRPLLARVPKDAWLFTNFKPASVDLCRATPGPTGVFNTGMLDAIYPFLISHTYAIDLFGLQPRGPRADLAGLTTPCYSWSNRPAQLFGLDDAWTLTPEERRELFSRPAYALLVRPPFSCISNERLDRRLIPRLKEGGVRLKEIGRRGEARLYRMESAPAS